MQQIKAEAPGASDSASANMSAATTDDKELTGLWLVLVVQLASNSR